MHEDIHVLVVDDDPRVVRGFAHALPPRSGVHVAGETEPTAIAAAFDGGTADVAVVDLDEQGLDTVRWLRRTSDRARVLAISEEQSPQLIAEALSAGACGLVSIEPEVDDLVGSLRRAKAGELVVPASELAAAVGHLERAGHCIGDEDRLRSLTSREAQTLRALAEGCSTDEIAARLGISRMTVQSHVKAILAKLGLHSKVEAVTLAWRYGFGPGTRSA